MTLTRRRALRRGALALGVGLAGCGSDDASTDSPTPTPEGSEATQGGTPTPGATTSDSPASTPDSTPTSDPQETDEETATATPTQAGVAWRFDLGADVGAAPAVADGVMYVGGWRETEGTPTPGGDPAGPSTTLRGIELAGGRERLRADVGAPVQVRPRVVDDTLYVVRGFDGLHGQDYQLRALSTDGRPQWRHEAQSLNFLSILGADGAGVVVGENDDNLGEGNERTVALAPDGTVLWRQDTADVSDGTADTETAYVTDYRRRVRAFDRPSGDQRWAVERDSLVRDPSVTDGGLVGATTVAFALDPATGDVRWTFDESPVQWLSAEKRRAFVTTGDGRLVALDVADGSEVWAVERAPRTPFAVGEAAVYRGREDGTLAAFDRATGDVLWTADVGEDGWISPAGDRVYVLGDERVQALAAADGTSLGSVSVGGDRRWVVDGGPGDAVVTNEGAVYGLAL